ncbi:MAG: hypothetical protein ACYDBJ_01905 [Aggregatilineales bacterium]
METNAKTRSSPNPMKRFRWWSICAVLFLGVACSPQTPLLLPTVAVIPTNTPSDTPSITPIPTNTDTPTDTLVPTDTFAPTNTLTPTPDVTPTPLPPSDTPTISRTPSFTPPPPSITPTPAPPTNTLPPPTAVPTRAPPTPTIGPVITSFTSDLMTVPANGQTILRWQTQADSVTLDELTATGTIVSSIGVDAVSDRSVLIPGNLGQSIIFRLTARRGGNTVSRSLTISIQCAIAWFFQPTPSGCPQQVAFPPSTIKYQVFEKGIGFFVAVTNNVYLLANAGNRVNAYIVDASYTPPPSLTPPGAPGKFFEPQTEIGYVWYYKQWSDGSQISNVLGWGTVPMQIYIGTMQQTGTDLYIQGPTGVVFKLALAGTGTWSIVGNVQ